MKINDMLRAQYVKRFHIVHTIKHQSIAEHSFNVAMIAREISIRFGYSEAAINMAVLDGIYHDLDEVITGDIPTPTKERAKAQGVDLNDNGISTPYRWDSIKAIREVVKAADYIEAAWFLGENGVGRHADSVKEDILDKMEEYFQVTFNVTELAHINDVCATIFSADFTI
jgi:hypothetical protein